MWLGAYESLVGWRYLLRRRKSYFALLVGLGILALGALLVGVGVWQQRSAGSSIAVFGNDAGLAQVLMGSGGGLCALGGCITLFGALNTWLTVFSAFGCFMVTIGVAEVILVLGVMNGFQGDLRAKIIDTNAHVVIEAPQYGDYLNDYKLLIEKARHIEGVLGASPVIQTEVMLSAPTNLAPVMLVGIDVGSVGQASKLPDQIKRGQLAWLVQPGALDALGRALPQPTLDELPSPSPEDAPAEELGEMAFPAPKPSGPSMSVPGLFLGAELRKNLALWHGEQLNVISPMGELGPQGPIPKSRPFRLAGWFESGMLEYDTKLAYASLESVQRYLDLGDVASAIQVRVADLEGAREVRDRLQAALGDTVRVTDWQERNSNLFSALKLEKIAMFLVLSINILLAAFSITSTLVMTIIERKREVAILMAMGSTSRAVLRIFMSQGAFVGLVGSVVGTVVGLGGAFTLARLGLPINTEVYYISAIPVDVRVMDVVAIIFVALLVSLVSTLYPAVYAARLRPVEGLSNE